MQRCNEILPVWFLNYVLEEGTLNTTLKYLPLFWAVKG